MYANNLKEDLKKLKARAEACDAIQRYGKFVLNLLQEDANYFADEWNLESQDNMKKLKKLEIHWNEKWFEIVYEIDNPPEAETPYAVNQRARLTIDEATLIIAKHTDCRIFMKWFNEYATEKNCNKRSFTEYRREAYHEREPMSEYTIG